MTAKKGVRFFDPLVQPDSKRYEPVKLSSYEAPMFLEGNELRQVWSSKLKKKDQQVERAVRILQQFVRKFMLAWILINDQRTDLMEEIEQGDENQVWELERVAWYKEDLQKHADMEWQVEQERIQNGEQELPEKYNHTSSPLGTNLRLIQQLQSDIRDVKEERHRLKHETQLLKKKNHQLSYILREKTPRLEILKFKSQHTKSNTQVQEKNVKMFLESVQTWRRHVHEATQRGKTEHKCKGIYKKSIVKILGMCTKRVHKKSDKDMVSEIMHLVKETHHL